MKYVTLSIYCDRFDLKKTSSRTPHSLTTRVIYEVSFAISKSEQRSTFVIVVLYQTQSITVNYARPEVWFFTLGHKVRVLTKVAKQRGRATFWHSRQEYSGQASECHLDSRGTVVVPGLAARWSSLWSLQPTGWPEIGKEFDRFLKRSRVC